MHIGLQILNPLQSFVIFTLKWNLEAVAKLLCEAFPVGLIKKVSVILHSFWSFEMYFYSVLAGKIMRAKLIIPAINIIT